MPNDPFAASISRHIWGTKYRFREGDAIHDRTIEDSWRRIATALAAVEQNDRASWEQRFYETLSDFKFLPGGRIQAGAGTHRRVTLFNCFVMGTIEDSMDGIFDGLKEGALTMQQGGGIGYDFSTLRPRGMPARSVGSMASGPVSFMRIWDSMCATLLSTGARRGAMMATLRCDHPDIEQFIEAKQDGHALRHFNLSVLVTDDFMQAVHHDREWALVFPIDPADHGKNNESDLIMRRWCGRQQAVPCRVVRRLRAGALWDKIMRATYDYAEPGVIFIDRVNQWNNLWYRETINATNPCGELPLPPYGACDLGSINLTRFVDRPFTAQARLDFAGIEATTRIAVRMMDNVIDASQFPLAQQATQAHGTRRTGLGFTGLADTLMMLGWHYGEAQARDLASKIMRSICHTAYRTSIDLAREKGRFPFFDKDKYLQSRFVRELPPDIQEGIARDGVRNSHLTAIAPTGTISLLANNVSSGLEPVYDFQFTRRVLELDGSFTEYHVVDFAYRLWHDLHGDLPPPRSFVTAGKLSPEAHLAMQAALQPYVDSSISKTINVPENYDFSGFKDIYRMAYDQGLKGCTTFRPNPVTGQILKSGEEAELAPHCCSVEREAD